MLSFPAQIPTLNGKENNRRKHTYSQWLLVAHEALVQLSQRERSAGLGGEGTLRSAPLGSTGGQARLCLEVRWEQPLGSRGQTQWKAGCSSPAALSPPGLLPPLLSSLLQEPLVFGELNIKGQKSHYIIKTQQDRN